MTGAPVRLFAEHSLPLVPLTLRNRFQKTDSFTASRARFHAEVLCHPNPNRGSRAQQDQNPFNPNHFPAPTAATPDQPGYNRPAARIHAIRPNSSRGDPRGVLPLREPKHPPEISPGDKACHVPPAKSHNGSNRPNPPRHVAQDHPNPTLVAQRSSLAENRVLGFSGPPETPFSSFRPNPTLGELCGTYRFCEKRLSEISPGDRIRHKRP